MTTDTPQPEPPPSTGHVIPIGHAPSARSSTAPADKLRHDNPHWPVRSPVDAANALLLHDECPWHCSTKVAALRVSDNDYQYFRDRGIIGGDSWTTPSQC